MVDRAKLRQALAQFLGDERFRKLLHQRGPGGRLRHWQEQEWARFTALHPQFGVSMEELLVALRICEVHGDELLVDTVDVCRGCTDRGKWYTQVRKRLFPHAGSGLVADDALQEGVQLEVSYCPACRKAEKEWQAKSVRLTFLRHDEEIDFVPLLKSGSIHYVSVAMPGFTVVSANIMFASGFDHMHRNDFMIAVNHGRETGTLYPKVNITLLPSPSASYGGMDSNIYNEGDYSEEQVVAHILDAFKANSQHVKSPKMYFDFRNLCVSETHYVSSLRAAMDQITLEELPHEVVTFEVELYPTRRKVRG